MNHLLYKIRTYIELCECQVTIVASNLHNACRKRSMLARSDNCQSWAKTSRGHSTVLPACCIASSDYISSADQFQAKKGKGPPHPCWLDPRVIVPGLWNQLPSRTEENTLMHGRKEEELQNGSKTLMVYFVYTPLCLSKQIAINGSWSRFLFSKTIAASAQLIQVTFAGKFFIRWRNSDIFFYEKNLKKNLLWTSALGRIYFLPSLLRMNVV